MSAIYKRIITGIVLIALVALIICCTPPWGFALLMALFLGIILIVEWPYLIPYQSNLFWLLTPFYPVLPFILVITMQLTGYELVNLFIIVLVALYDTASYLIGSLWGVHKINTFISPGKTWEGFIGGTFITTTATLTALRSKITTGTIIPLTFITLGICVCALVGDLFESLLKRKAGVKDSGTLLPGHGGLLDRFDGMMFASILGYYFKDSIQQLLTRIS